MCTCVIYHSYTWGMCTCKCIHLSLYIYKCILVFMYHTHTEPPSSAYKLDQQRRKKKLSLKVKERGKQASLERSFFREPGDSKTKHVFCVHICPITAIHSFLRFSVGFLATISVSVFLPPCLYSSCCLSILTHFSKANCLWEHRHNHKTQKHSSAEEKYTRQQGEVSKMSPREMSISILQVSL